MTLLVSDELDLIERNIDYHLAQGVDFVVVTVDQGAPASIITTIERYVDRGVCHLIEDDPSGYLQGAWITRMARMAAVDFGADWVINSDIDEFYWPENGTLKGIFTAIPAEYGKLILPVNHFAPRPDGGFFADRMTLRETRSLKGGGRRVLTKVAHRGAADVEVSRGGHRATGTGLAPLVGWEPIVGLHFPLRSFGQFEAKVRRDGRTADPHIQNIRRELYERYSAGSLAEVYEGRIVDDAEARAGVEEGRFVMDERLKRFFEVTKHPPPGEPTPDEVASLKVEMERAVEEHERHPLTLEVRYLRQLLEAADERFHRSRRKAENLRTQVDKAGAKSARLRKERNAVRRELKGELNLVRAELKLVRAQLETAERWKRPFRRARNAIDRWSTVRWPADRRGGDRSGRGRS
jgi:hypothetical protein